MSQVFDALFRDLALELTRRDGDYPKRFPPRLPSAAEIDADLDRLGLDAAVRDRLTDLVEEGIARLETQGLARRQGGADPVGRVMARGLIDCGLADEGLSPLHPSPRDERPMTDLLKEDYAAHATPAGRRYWTARRAGRPLLLINALGLPLDYWRPLLADRAGGFAPIVAETRCGDIHAGGMATAASLTDHAEDLIEVLETRGGGAVDVLAWCNGGRIAVDLAGRRPDLVRSLTLLGPTMRGAAGPSPTSGYEDLLQKIFDNVKANPGFAAPMTRMLAQFFGAKDWTRAPGDEAARAATFLALPDAAHARGLAAPMATGEALLNYAGRTAADEAYPIREAVAGLSMKLLVITGDCDNIISNAHTREVLRGAPDVRFLEVEGAGHYIQHLQYPYLRLALSRFLENDTVDAAPATARMGGLRPPDGPPVPEWWYRSRAPGRRGRRYPLAELFAWPAAVKPSAPALSDGEVRLTFGQLERGSRHLAARLSNLGLASGGRVLVLSEKRAVMPVVAGGIWKAQGVYVPVDAQNPPERLANMAGQARPAVVVGAAAALVRLDGLFGDTATVTFEEILAASLAETEPAVLAAAGPVDEEAEAYVIFTSGSTGSPKGVAISHRSLLDYFYNHNQVLRFGPASRTFSLAPFHFDISIEDTLLPLSLGAFVYQFRALPAGPLMRRLLRREKITHLIAVSSLLALITGDGAEVSAETFPDLEMVMTGAEECDPRLIDIWVERLPQARILNVYGPTEATIVCLTHTITAPEPERATPYPIGRPLPGVKAMLLDEQGGRITTADTPGELLIGGSQVMIGYVGRPDDTARACPVIDGVRYYRTGDRCHLDAAGRFVFGGRLDDMVKIAGRRIHLGEIRHQALELAPLQQAIVGLIERAGGAQIGLIAVARPSDGEAEPDLDALRAALARRLPAYMVPTVIGSAREAVLTVNGKSDDRTLLALLARAAERHPAAAEFRLVAGSGFEPRQAEPAPAC
ncbi:MAG TPA: alpha/beta fold hydrolase [Allosphingosinicella sp.]